MDGKKLLILRLEGMLQAWGAASKWDERSTEDLPTKSGIVGLLGCAMGLERGNPELAALSNALTVVVRTDRPGRWAVDFQTVTGNPLRNAEGKPKSTGNTIISKRSYLQDACFTVFLETDESWHDRIVAALKSPKWCMYLGRKACVPSRPVLECEEPEYPDLSEALFRYPPAPRAEYPMTFETELPDDRLASLTRADDLIGANREFARRRVWRGVIKEEQSCT